MVSQLSFVDGQGLSRKAATMMKNELPRLSPEIDETPQRSTTSFSEANLGHLFYALLDKEDVEEMFREFLVPARPQ
jgi:hypothetical protein